MNREILFRGKSANTGIWVEGFGVKFGEKYSNIFVSEIGKLNLCNGVIPVFEHELVISETVGQYTGLTDKNGVKIFDGDVIRAYHNGKFMNISYIRYDAPEYLCELISGINIDMVDSLSDYHDEYAIEVVGNVHDNPELIMVKLAEDDFSCASIICELCKKFNTDECKPVADCSCFELRYADDVK